MGGQELIIGGIGTAVGVALSTAVDIVRTGVATRRERRRARDLGLDSKLNALIGEVRELQGAVFSGITHHETGAP